MGIFHRHKPLTLAICLQLAALGLVPFGAVVDAASGRIEDGIPWAHFRNRFENRISASPTQLTVREIYDTLNVDGDQMINDAELQGLQALVPAPAMTRKVFMQTFKRELEATDLAQVQDPPACLPWVFL